MTNIEEIQLNHPWINHQLFTTILKGIHPGYENIEIINFTARMALPKGENYWSQLIRVNIAYTTDSNQKNYLNVIVKAVLPDKEFKQITHDFGVFQREIQMYRDIMPDVQNVLLEVNDKSELWPKCYQTNYDESYLIFDDLSVKNYRNVDRVKGLDYQHFELVITKIAKWHAATAYLLSKDRKFPDFEKHVMEYSPIMNDIASNSVKSAAIVSSRSDDLRKISEKLFKLHENLTEKFHQSSAIDDQTFTALCHGDLWSNNIMFKYNDDGQPIDAILLDFQISFIGPAVLDLSTFLFSASTENVQDRDWDLLIHHYHSVLSDSLRKLNYSKTIPSLIDIHKQFLSRAVGSVPLGLMAACGRSLDVNQDENNDATKFTGDTPEGETLGIKIFENPKCTKLFRFLLDFFYRKGILD